jgi:hypothetical protein
MMRLDGINLNRRLAMTPERTVDIDAAFELGTPINEAMQEAFVSAVELHRQAGVPLVVWRDGKIEHVSAETITENLLEGK